MPRARFLSLAASSPLAFLSRRGSPFLALCPCRRVPLSHPRDNLQRGRRYCMSDARVSFSAFLFLSVLSTAPRDGHRQQRENPLCKMVVEDTRAPHCAIRSQDSRPGAHAGSLVARHAKVEGGDDGGGCCSGDCYCGYCFPSRREPRSFVLYEQNSLTSDCNKLRAISGKGRKLRSK